MATLKALDGKMQMISGEGELFYPQTQKFVEELKKYSTASSYYTVVSIIGPQSSGKSYLLNTVFETNFDVLIAAEGRKQTTKGIWIAKCNEPCMIIIDVEGCDGREREDDTLFERQSALFSLAVSDVMLLNMWFHDIGRQQGANFGLLKLIFEQRVKIEAPKTTIIILVRDYDYETPLDITKKDLKKDMNELWEKVHPATTDRKMSDYIEVIVKDFPHKSHKQEFAQKSKVLANFLCYFAASGSPEQNHCASSFAYSSQRIWDRICKNERLCAADHKLFMSAYVCTEIKNEILNSLDQETGYGSLMSDTSMSVNEFNTELRLFLKRVCARYEDETRAFDGNTRDEKRVKLENKILKRFEPTFKEKIVSLSNETLNLAKSKIHDKLLKLAVQDISSLVATTKLYVTAFDDNSRSDVHPYFEKVILNECREEFAKRLARIAEDEAKIISKNNGLTKKIISGLLGAPIFAVGTAWACVTLDPSILLVGIACL